MKVEDIEKLHERFKKKPIVNSKKILTKYISKHNLKIKLNDRIKNHKMFSRTDRNVKAFIDILNIRIESYKKKMSFICTELNKMRGELNICETIIAYRQQENIQIKDNINYGI